MKFKAALSQLRMIQTAKAPEKSTVKAKTGMMSRTVLEELSAIEDPDRAADLLMQTALDNPLKDLYTGYVDFGCGWGDGRQIVFSNPA